MVFPAVWDWYLNWLARRRGFFNLGDTRQLYDLASLTRENTGWLRQRPELKERIKAVPGLITEADITNANQSWNAICTAAHAYAKGRLRELHRIARRHRDTFAPVLPVLNAPSPLKIYRRIADEVWRMMPDRAKTPAAAAEAMRAYLMVRFLLHTGLRQRNLRTLLLCGPNERPRSERKLEQLRCGELRWIKEVGAWEVFIPAVAFKNATSMFFMGNPYRFLLPDFDGLYDAIDRYLSKDRPYLLAKTKDPHTFFIASKRRKKDRGAYTAASFYMDYLVITQRYGIYNPYTKRGAIEGLMPHGPHCVRDVLATHILKTTGSFDLAAYAIQGSPITVKRHYGRFLPQDKSALAAQILNLEWADEQELFHPKSASNGPQSLQVDRPKPLLKQPRYPDQ
jgi:hypothetical protein